MKRIADSFVDEVRRRVDIVDVVSEYVQLRREGRRFVGLCPFHNERSPSFSVSPDKQVYYCFGCHAGGNVIGFLMDIDGVPYVDAVIQLAGRANLELPAGLEDAGRTPQQTSIVQRMKDAHELATKYYNYILMNTKDGVQALTYLEGRGISRATAVQFRMGYAPTSANRVVKFLQGRGYEPSLLVDAGIVVAMGDRIVDRFRGRLMIPIMDAQGKVIAFGGRAITGDGHPKYLNSPETQLFRKGHLLFNQQLARKEIRRTHEVVLMEGYMDVITAWQAGVTNAVATMGTAFTAEHASLLKRLAGRVTIAYDGDSAGVAAAERALDIADDVGLATRVVRFPDKMDPDEFIRTHGSQAFQHQLSVKALSAVEFLIEKLQSESNLQSHAGRTEFLRRAIELLQVRATPIEQETELRRLSQEFQVSVETLKEELNLVAKHTNRRRETASVQTGFGQQTRTPLPKDYVEAGNMLLQAVLTEAESYAYILEQGVDELPLPEQTALLALVYGYRAEHPEMNAAAFLDTLEDAGITALATSLLMKETLPFHPGVLDDCIKTIRKHDLSVARQQAERELTEALLRHDTQAIQLWKERVDELRRNIERLTTPSLKSIAGGVKEAGKK